MPKFNKPYAPNLLWAQDALEGQVVKPDDDKIAEGWIKEKPPLQIENWSIQRANRGFAYLNQLGFPEWDAETEYQANQSYVQGSDGIVYQAVVTNTGQDPATGSNRWRVAFLYDNAVTAFIKSLLDDATAEEARATLLLGSAAVESDSKYLHRANNLSDITTPATAFSNIKQPATTERSGVVELATPPEVAEGLRNDVAVTPHSLGGGINPAGTIITFAGSVAPVGYFECDGRTLSRTEYATLFGAIGTTFGSGDGSTTFQIPDTRGMFVRGWDHGKGIDNGRSLGSTQSDQNKAHNHSGNTETGGSHSHTGATSSAGNHSHTGSTNTTGNHRHDVGPHSGVNQGQIRSEPFEGQNYSSQVSGYAGDHSHTLYINSSGNHSHSVSINSGGEHSHSFSTSSSGGNESRPVNISFMHCIKY